MDCGTCKHWVRDEWDPDEYGDGDEYDVIKSGEHNPETKWGECQRVAKFGPRQGASQRFFVIDASHYSAHLQTREDFGCIEHEVKE